MSHGIDATQHLFPEHCEKWRNLQSALTFAEGGLRGVARRLARRPNDVGLQNQLGSARAERNARRSAVREHLAGCVECAVAEGLPS